MKSNPCALFGIHGLDYTRRHDAVSACLGPLVYARKTEEMVTALRLAQAALPEVLEAHGARALSNPPLGRLRHTPQRTALVARARSHGEAARQSVLVNTRMFCNDDECCISGQVGVAGVIS